MISKRYNYINEQLNKHLKEFKQHYPDLEWIYMGLQGSQNYNLDIYTDTYKSDIDTKIIVLPSLKDIILNRKPISTTHICPNQEHIDIKDIRLMFECFKKQNINFIEILFTKFNLINVKYFDLITELINKRELIAHYNTNQALRCMAGMSMEKRKALCHPYPTIKDKIEKYGYDGKQLHHIIRMNDFIKAYGNGESFETCLTYLPHKDLMLKAKLNEYSLDEAISLADTMDTDTKIKKDNFLMEQDVINQEAKEILDKIQYHCIKRYFKKELECE